MKKLFSLFAASALLFAFSACEDVPAPYGVADPNDPSTPVDETILVSESFASSLGSFTSYTTDGAGAWTIDYSTAKAAGYDNNTKVTTDGTYYLVSQEVDLTDCEGAYVQYDYILRYLKANENQQFLVQEAGNFSAAAAAEGWTVLNQTHTEGSDWSTFSTAKFNIPSEWMGKKVRFALKYTCSGGNGSTWEVKNLLISKGQVEADDDPVTPVEPDEPVTPVDPSENLLQNGDFETWADGLPTYWKSTTTASAGNLSQSTDAHSGTYAVKLEGNETANKRIAYKELTLRAGTYTFTIYGKSAGQMRLGYTPVTEGKVGSYSYQSGYVTLSATAWTQGEYTFTLSAETTVNLVVMNPKTSSYAAASDLLLDDAVLTTSDGGIVGGDTPVTPDEPVTPTAGYSIDFTASQTGWTIDDKSMDDALSYVWQATTSYGYKASAYVSGNKAAESWLISPEISLSGLSAPTLTINHALNYCTVPQQYLAVKASTDGGATWTDLSLSAWPAGNSWTFEEATASLAAFVGKTIKIAFAYKSTTSVAGTWEIKSVKVQ